jgi:ABC-type siderophore export system fused ATPase/permease subunit
MYKEIAVDIVKGVLLALVYFEITKANDTTLQNVGLFVGFYVIMIISARIADIEPSIVTNAFITKAVFTLVDERIKQKDPKNTTS